MSYIPNCRTHEFYNEKYLVGDDFEFVRGYDWAVSEILNLFANLDVYFETDEIRGIPNAEKFKDAIEDWAEMGRNELITSMIDNMDEDEYDATKARVDAIEEGVG